MQVRPADVFYHNDTAREVLVTYEIRGQESPVVIELVDGAGALFPGCSVAAGRVEDHTFCVPPGGKLRCLSGAGACIWQNPTVRSRLADHWLKLSGWLRWIGAYQVRPGVLLTAYVVGLLWLNFYICRQTFFIEYTGRVNSIQGVWIAMARLGGGHWFRPSWWPYWYNGMPFEYTYAPMVPGLTALISWLAHFSAARGLEAVSGIVYCIGPVALFLMARELSGRQGWSFIAAIVYSLSAPTQLVLPDTQFSWVHLRDARRLYLSYVWDELPHQLAVALVCLAVLFIARVLREPKFRNYVWASLFVALSLLTSAFGATGLVLSVGCLLATRKKADWRRNFLSVGICAVAGYLAMCPFLPPSLIGAIRSNSKLFDNMAWSRTSTWTFLGVLAGGVILWFVSRNWRASHLRFCFLLTYLTIVIPAVYIKWDLHFLPEPARYLVELEEVLPLLVVFAIALLVDRLPKSARLVLAILLLWPAAKQIASQRRFSKDLIRPVNMTGTIEYQIAHWTETNLPGWRVAAPGSIWPWLNTFSRVPQFSGGSYPTAPSVPHLRVEAVLPGTPEDKVLPVVWYKAYGVDAVVAPGEKSPEFWQPHTHGHQFDGIFPVAWDERDTKIYAVPRPARTLAHVIPISGLVSHEPTKWEDVGETQRYVAALEAADGAAANFRWIDDNRAHVHASVGANQAVSVQMTWHRGWKATAGGVPVATARDGLGQMVLRPERPGDYEISLTYDGGWENKLCRLVSAATVLAAVLAMFFRRKARPA